MSTICGRRGRTLIPTLLALLMLTPLMLRSARADSIGNAAASGSSRAGAGLRVGNWEVDDLVRPPSGRASETVAVQGWFQKGLDARMVLENTLGFWQRNQSMTTPGSFGTQTRRELTTYLVPTITALKLYPSMPPTSPVEPYVVAGAGAVLGIDQEKITSTDPLVASGSNTTFQPGLGIETGAGLDWISKGAFGVTAGARYRWASFQKSVGDKKLYRGMGLNIGLTYRFQKD